MSESSPFDQAAEILERVEALPAEERTSTAVRLAEGRPEVLALLEPMLAGLQEEQQALERPVLQGLTGFEQGFAGFGEGERPEQIAGYRIVRPLGEGGMGIVYEAQQASPNRRVALKLLRGGLLDPSLLKRFEQETAVLGYLNHPGIAQVYEGGTAQVGAAAQPFIAMEFVQGEPIDRYAQNKRLSIRAKAALMADLCDAVQHAHQKGVVHRDLKPANVLVDERGGIKVLDFGIARIADTEHGATSTGQVVGTLPYMSPEQVSGQGGIVDTRCDVYSLGVIAYELFGGVRPIDVAGMSLPEAARAITEQEPKALGSIFREGRGDLETIVGKALRKDREERYGSAGNLGDEWRRFLAREPILAHPPSRAYLLRKFVRRNPAWVAGMATFLALIIGFAAVTAVQNRRIAEQRDLAERKNRLSWEVADFLVELFEMSNPSEARSRQLSARGLLDLGSQRIRNNVTEDLELRSELLLVMARTYNALGVPDAAKPLLDEAVAIRAAEGFDAEGLVAAQYEQAVWFALQGRFDGALEKLETVIDSMESIGWPDAGFRLRVQKSRVNSLLGRQLRPAAMELAEATYAEAVETFGEDSIEALQALAMRGGTYEEMARFDEALADLQKARAGILQLRSEQSPEYIAVLRLLGSLYKHMELPAKCIEIMEEALRLDRIVFGEDHPNVDEDLYDLASALSDMGELDASLKLFQEVLERDRRILGEEHPYVGIDHTEIGDLYSHLGKYDFADEHYRIGIAIQRKAFPDDHLEIATTLNNFANHCQRSGNYERSLELHQEALRIRESQLPPGHPVVLSSHNAVGVLLGELGRYEEAEPRLRAVLEGRRKVYGRKPSVAGALFTVAHNLDRQDRPEEALPLVEEAIGIYEEFNGRDHLDTARAWFFHGRLLLKMERLPEAKDRMEEALRVRRMRLDGDHRYVAAVEFALGDVHFQLGNWEQAQRLCCRALKSLVHQPRPLERYLQQHWERFQAMCQEQGVEPPCDVPAMKAGRGR